MSGFVNTKDDIIGLFYLRKMIKHELDIVEFEDKHFHKIAADIDGLVFPSLKSPNSQRTVRRLLEFEKDLGNRRKNKATDLVKWYCKNKYNNKNKYTNFDQFVKEEKDKIDAFYKKIELRTENEKLNSEQKAIDDFFDEINICFNGNHYIFPTEASKRRKIKPIDQEILDGIDLGSLKSRLLCLVRLSTEMNDQLKDTINIISHSLSEDDSKIIEQGYTDGDQMGIFGTNSSYYWLIESSTENSFVQFSNDLLNTINSINTNNGTEFSIRRNEKSVLIKDNLDTVILEIRPLLA